jgi:hypothetical protein
VIAIVLIRTASAVRILSLSGPGIRRGDSRQWALAYFSSRSSKVARSYCCTTLAEVSPSHEGLSSMYENYSSGQWLDLEPQRGIRVLLLRLDASQRTFAVCDRCRVEWGRFLGVAITPWCTVMYSTPPGCGLQGLRCWIARLPLRKPAYWNAQSGELKIFKGEGQKCLQSELGPKCGAESCDL